MGDIVKFYFGTQRVIIYGDVPADRSRSAGNSGVCARRSAVLAVIERMLLVIPATFALCGAALFWACFKFIRRKIDQPKKNNDEQ